MGSVKALMRIGSVSGKAAGKWQKPAILSQTRSQKGRMTDFDHKQRDEASAKSHGAIPLDHKGGHINAPMLQADRANSMPSKQKGASSGWLKSEGKTNNMSKSTQGGQVQDDYAPGRRQINEYPQKQASTFPRGAGYEGGPSAKTGNTRMKAARVIKSGGPSGGNAKNNTYYGGPNGRDGT